MWAKLTSLNNRFSSIDLKKNVMTFGRSDKCDVSFENKIISTNHFTISKEEDQSFITDLSYSFFPKLVSLFYTKEKK